MPARRLTLPPKTCTICHSTFTRGEREPTDRYRKRMTCGAACLSELKRRASRRANARTVPPPRACVVCGQPFHRHEREQLQHFMKRRTCSQACKGRLISRARRARPVKVTGRRRLDLGPKKCLVCGSTFRRRDGECTTNFRARRTCSPACTREVRRASVLKATRAMQRQAAERRAQKAKAKAPAKKPAKAAPVKAPRPPQPATAPRKPAPPIPVPQAEPTQRWQPPQRHEPIRLQPLGEPCPDHPGEVIGVFGCPACNAGRKWRERGQIAHVGIGSRP